MRWDPQQYARYGDERGRPFLDLLARIGADAPRRVVDLGCGPGTLTALLAQRWPGAVVEGIDASPEMIAESQPAGRLSFRVGTVEEWTPPPDLDVLISNATLQWVPTHRDLLRGWATALPDGAWLAFQVPGNFDAPSHALLRELAREWGIEGALRSDATSSPDTYARLLLAAGLTVDAWETTYLHVLPGADPVLEWLRGTGLRPVLAALPADQVADFSVEFAARLRTAYPAGPHGTLFPFRRIFAVAHRA
jgi:trans-aconitate 2-methyltransferase